MNWPVLYSFRRCPYAMRARLALWQSGVTVVLREVVLRDKPPALLAASPKGTVPVLVLPDGQVLEQSLDIMRWALAQHDPAGWLRTDEADHAPQWLMLNDGPFKRALDGYKYPGRGVTRGQTDDGRDCRSEAEAVLLIPMQAQLSRRPALGGDRWGLADHALLPFVRQFAQVDWAWFDAQPWPELKAWLAQGLASPLMAAVMGKFPAWREGDPLTLWGGDQPAR